MTLKLGILGSTRGTALQGVLDAIAEGSLDARIMLVLSDKEEAPILARAAQAGAPHQALAQGGMTRDTYDRELDRALRESKVELVLMVGWMRIMSPWFVKAWEGKLLNVHPSLLPAFAGGMNRDVHRAVLASGAKETGCTIHLVTEEVDKGPILLQKTCAVRAGDTVESLKARVQALEKQAFVELLQKWGQT